MALTSFADLANASTAKLRRIRRYTWAPNGWNTTTTRSGTGLWGTQFLTACCPDDFFAVRVGFPNITTNATLVVPKIAVVASTTYNDGCNPTGGLTPTTLTSFYAGAPSDRITTATGTNSLTILPNATDISSGETTVATWTWSDWANVNSATPDPATNMRVLMIRYTVNNNNGGAVTFTNGGLVGWVGVNAINNGYDTFVGGLNNGSDHTAFDSVTASTAVANSLVNGQFIGAVQFMTKRGVVQGLGCGDSHHAGTTTTAQMNCFLAQSMTSMGKANVGSNPMGFSTAAMGGLVSQQMFPYMQSLLPFVNPSFVVLPGWTYNELDNSTNADALACNRFFARLLQAADVVRLSGAIPIWLTPFPRSAATMTAVQVAPWLALRQEILAMQGTGAVVLDATAVLGNVTNGTFDGTFLPGLSTDGVHPNDYGHSLVATLLTNAVTGLMDLS